MKKVFDSVQMMRKIRVSLSQRYAGRPQLEMRELRGAGERFAARQVAMACAPHVAESPAAHVSQRTLKMLDKSVANLKKGLVSDPIDLSALAETPPPPRSKGKRKRSN